MAAVRTSCRLKRSDKINIGYRKSAIQKGSRFFILVDDYLLGNSNILAVGQLAGDFCITQVGDATVLQLSLDAAEPGYGGLL